MWIRRLVVDKDGNTVVTGEFPGGTNGFAMLPVAESSRSAFLAKYDSEGVLQWAFQPGGTGRTGGTGLALGESGSVFMVGTVSGEATVGTAVLRAPEGSVFMAKFDAQGRPEWAKLLAARSDSSNPQLASNGDGNVYLLDSFRGSVRIGDTLLQTRTELDFGRFVAKFDSTGTPAWAWQPSGSAQIRTIAAGPDGTLHMAGAFVGVANLQGLSFSTEPHKTAVFVAKCDPNGAPVWVIPSEPHQSHTEGDLAVDSEGCTYLVGQVLPQIGFGKTMLAPATELGSRTFLAKFDPAGRLMWLSAGVGYGQRIALDSPGCAYVFGSFYGTNYFGNLVLRASDHGEYVVRYDQAGGPCDAVHLPNSPAVTVSDFAVGTDSESYLAGFFQGTCDFGSTRSTSAESGSAWLGKGLTAPPSLAPVVTTQPRSQVVFRGDPVFLAAGVTGAAPIFYQWQQDGTDLPAATNATLVIPNAQLHQSGKYRVVVRNTTAFVITEEAELAVNQRIEAAFVTTVAGTNAAGLVDGLPISSRLFAPNGGAVGADGPIYAADTRNHVIRKLETTGHLTTIAGSKAGYLDGPGLRAEFDSPLGTALAPGGTVLVADTGNNRIRRIRPAPPYTVSTVAGSGRRGYRDGPAAVAEFDFPNDLVLDSSGNIFVTEFNNHTIRKVSANGDVSTIAGNGVAGYLDATGEDARLAFPAGVAIDGSDSLYVTEWGNHRVRKVTPAGVVTTWAGSGLAGFLDGPATLARFREPDGIVADAAGFLYLTEHGNHSVRRISPQGDVITIAGTGSPRLKDGSNAAAQFNTPGGIVLAAGNILTVADTGNHALRKISLGRSPLLLTQPASQQVALGARLQLSVLAAGETPLTYRWSLNDQTLSGATNATLEIPSMRVEDAGQYLVQVENTSGAVQSTPVTISLGQPAVPEYAWVQALNGFSPAPPVGFDSFGNAYLFDYYLTQYDTAGKARWGQPVGSAPVVGFDAKGNVYAAGAQPTPLLSKFDIDGERLWQVPVQHSSALGTSLAVDAEGNCYIGGLSKYDHTGQLVWSRPASSGLLATDRLGHIYQAIGLTLAQYDSDGNRLWSRQVSTNAQIVARGFASDPVGNLYLTGWIWGNVVTAVGTLSSSPYDFYLIKCDRHGKVLWARQSGMRAVSNGLAIGRDGVYITGGLWGPGQWGEMVVPDLLLRAPIETLFFVAKYDFDGNIVWIQRISSDPSKGDSIAADQNGNLIISGSCWGKVDFGSVLLEHDWTRTFLLRMTANQPLLPGILTLSWNQLQDYVDRWRNGTNWSAVSAPVSIDAVTAAGRIWAAGGDYIPGPEESSSPLSWTPAGRERGSTNGLVSLALPEIFVPGEPFLVTVQLAPDTATLCSAAAVHIPAGWGASDGQSGGQFDAAAGQIRWGPWFGDKPRKLQCRVTPTSLPAAPPVIEAVASFDGASKSVFGEDRLAMTPGQLVARTSQHGLEVMMWAQPASLFTLYSSADLMHWEPLGLITSTNGFYLWTVTSDPQSQSRYFRAVASEIERTR